MCLGSNKHIVKFLIGKNKAWVKRLKSKSVVDKYCCLPTLQHYSVENYKKNKCNRQKYNQMKMPPCNLTIHLYAKETQVYI